MKREKIDRRLEKALRDKITADLYYGLKDHENCCGLPLGASKSMVLLARTDDFLWNGYQMVNRRALRKVKLSHTLEDEILRRDGLLDEAQLPDVDVTGWQGFFESLCQSGRHIIVQANGEWDVTIGPVLQAKKNKALVWHYDADGKWEQQPRIIRYQDIFYVSFDGRRETAFAQAVAGRPHGIEETTITNRNRITKALRALAARWKGRVNYEKTACSQRPQFKHDRYA